MGKKHGAWTIESSECRYKDDFVEFWVDECLKPDGEPGRRATLRMLPGVAVLALDEEGFAHMIRKFRYAIGRESVEAVQGATDEGESEAEAARRELKEELGIEARELTDLGLVDAVTSQVFSPSRIFLARGLAFGEHDRESTEVLQPFKVKLGEAVRMVMDGEITQATTCVLVLKAARLLADE
ncbi:MAG TPA: NUDIX hydrolase [Pyrinomonadaceae bacterium]|nr:NUDIX hydrolase [Pyrinomonadaceae bacterium]